MNKFVRLTLISLCAIALVGCATKKEIVSLPEKVQNEIGSTDIYIEECEKKIRADIESSNLTNYAGGGLLFALVDSAIMAYRENCADDALVDVHKELSGFNFQEKFRERLSQMLKNTSWLHAKKINHITGIDDAGHQEIFSKSDTDCVLTSKFIYKLDEKFNVMTGTLYLTLYPTSLKMKKLVGAQDPLETPLFKFHISATEALRQAGQDIETKAKLWAKNNGLKLKQALENILNQAFSKLEMVLENPNHLPEA